MTTSVLTDAAPDGVALLDVEQVAALCGCSTRHVRRLADAGKMPSSFKLGALLRWRKVDIDGWIAGGCKPIRAVSRKGVRT